MADRAGYDVNLQPTLLAVSSADGTTPVVLEADPSTHALIVQATISTVGLATSAKQDTGNTSLASIDGKLPVLGQALAAASIPVVLTAAQLSTLTPSATTTSAISTNNSSTATLLSGAVFTGTGEDVTTYSEMRVSVISNVASASDGLSFQQSSDNTNWDITDIYTIAASTGKTIVVPRQAKFFRIVYTNGGTNQGSFRLQTILNRTGTAPSSQRPNDAYTNETDLVQGQSFLMGYNGTTWDRVRTVGTGVLSASAVLTAGSALIGKVGIDQTTLGTTNNVSVSGSTGAGTSALIKDDPSFGDGVTSGILSAAVRLYNGSTYDRLRGDATNGLFANVKVLPALVTGSAVIGKVSIDQTTPGTTNLVALAANQTMNLNQIAGNSVSTGVGAVGTGVQRVVDANGAGRTLASTSGSAASSGNNTLVAAGTNKLKVYAFSLTTTSTTAVTCIFQSGAGGTELWRVILQAPTSVNVGANLAVAVPSYLFSTATATLLNLNLSGAQTVHWSVAYYDEA